MDSTQRLDPIPWASSIYRLIAPRIQVKGRMALIVLAAVLWAFLWLLIRAYTVIQLSNDELVEKLGLDIPPEPDLTLEEVAEHHVQISWKPCGDVSIPASSISEYHIEVNGRIVGNTRRSETAALISNLNSSTSYSLRVFGVSPGRFQTPSLPLHVRTLRTSSTSSQDSTNDGLPQVRALVSRICLTSGPTSTSNTARQHNEGQQPSGRRGTGMRRPSPAGQTEGSSDGRDIDEETGEDLAELSQQFQKITEETETIETQIHEESREFDTAVREREVALATLKQEMKERDDASNELKKQVHRAEAQNRTLQNEKSKKEKQLKDKEQKRKRKRDEIAKWDERSQSMADEIEGINKQKEAIRKRTESEASEVREKNVEEQKEIQQLEEENRELSVKIKELQEERKRNAVDEETEESREADRRDQERDLRFRHSIQQLSQQYSIIWAELQKAQQEHVLARQRMAMMETARRNTIMPFAATAPVAPIDMDLIQRNEKLTRRNRHASSHGSNVSSPRNAFMTEPFPTVNQQVTTSPLNARNTVFNSVNGMSLPIAIPAPSGGDDEEDSFSAAPMSPRGEALLPFDLLGDESSDDIKADDEDDAVLRSTRPDHQNAPFPIAPPSPLRHTQVQSPDSSASRSVSSPGSFVSPREEFFPENDLDRRSVHSSQPPIPEDSADTNHRRLPSMSHLFSFNRQRGKTSTDEPPALGTLNNKESHSFPRNFNDGLEDDHRPSRRLSYGNAWGFGNGIPGRSSEAEVPKPTLARRAFMMSGLGKSASRNYDPFAPRTKALEPAGRGGSSSPRPGSVYSIDRMPRMSMEEAFRTDWRYNQSGARNSPLAPDWGSAISRTHSRRQSLYGSTTNLSFSQTNDVDDGEFIEPQRDPRPLQAPIGTRPASSKRPDTPKLNPAAPSFTMFGFGKNRDRTKDRDREKDKDKIKSDSPPESRKSRDAPSFTNTFSTSESRDSLERVPSGLSAGPSLESTPASKPTFISKITRKASSNKFDSWKHKSTTLFSSRNKIGANGEALTPTGDVSTTEDEQGFPISIPYDQLSKSVESNASTPGAEDKKEKANSRTSLGGWNFMKRKKKEDLTASEISENGELVSESGDGTDHDREVSLADRESVKT